jgi:hypothetical protein
MTPSSPTAAPCARWSAGDAERRLAAVLGLATRAVPVLAAPVAGEPADALLKRIKLVAESALLLHVAAAVPGLDQETEALADVIEPHARSLRLLTAMRLRPCLTEELAVPHSVLTSIGRPDPAFEREVRTLLATPQARQVERVPWKDLEAAWHARLAGRAPLVDPAASVPRTTVALGLDVLTARREERYAFTHGLIYLTGFGADRAMLPRPSDVLVEEVDGALAACLDDDDFDLAAEVLMTWPYIREPWTPAGAFGLGVLGRVEDEVGILPSLTLQQHAAEDLADDEERDRYYLQEAYHTAYVMGLLCAATLRADADPRCSAAGGERSPAPPIPGASATLMELLLPRPQRPQWEQDFAALDAATQDELAPFVAAVALRRAVSASDPGHLHRVLSACVALGLPLDLAIRQGAELLQRLVAD